MAEQIPESQTVTLGESFAPLESVLFTGELHVRPARPPDHAKESGAMAALAQAMADSPGTILQKLADIIIETCQSDSAGISLLTTHDGGKRFYWPAIAGAWKNHIGGGTPREFGPCGAVLDSSGPLLFRHLARRYTYFESVSPLPVEALLVPFYLGGKAVGTIWAVTHNERHEFDAEDLRQLESLGRFAAAAYQVVTSLAVLEQQSEMKQHHETELTRRLAELQTANASALEARRAAVHLMEDAVHSRELAETLNVQLQAEISGRKKAQEAVDQRTAQFETLLNEAPLGVYLIDADFRVREANPTARSVFGDIPDLIGRDFEEVIHILWAKGHADDIVRRFRHTLGTGEPFMVCRMIEERIDRRVTENYEWQINRIQVPGGGYGVVCYFRDISSHVHAQAAVAEREEKLRSLNTDLKHFSYAASHDLQEPLRMVMTYTQLLAREYKGRLDQTADMFIAYAVDGAERMESLLRDLREYWSVNEQKVEKLVPVDCNRILEKTLNYMEISIRESGAVITHDCLPVVMAEEVPLVLLFQNLIGNAIKCRQPEVPVRIHLSALLRDQAGAQPGVQQCGAKWKVSVTDNGIGIEAQHLETIFAPFKRLHGREVPGTGIGLAMCQKIVERYQGRIWAESTYGQGSAFHFTLAAPDRET